MTPMDKLREAVAALDISVWPAKSRVHDLCNAAEAVLAETPATGTWAWAVEQMRQGRKVRRRDWGYREATLCVINGDSVVWVESCDQYRLHLTDIDATDWELLQPAHKPCPHCGGRPLCIKDPWWIECYECHGRTDSCDTETEAWRLWDRRAEVKP